jgi:hypothetical protein
MALFDVLDEIDVAVLDKPEDLALMAKSVLHASKSDAKLKNAGCMSPSDCNNIFTEVILFIIH